MPEFSKIAPHLANPLILVGFALFVLFGLYRALLRSGVLVPVSRDASKGVVRLILHYGFIVAALIILGGFALAFWRARSAAHSYKALTRLDAEAVIQEYRGNIERCLSSQRDILYLDFVLTSSDNVLNVDVYAGKKLSENDWVHVPPLGKEKLSIFRPDVNACIVGTLRNVLNSYNELRDRYSIVTSQTVEPKQRDLMKA
jgi:hypothetical protein